MRPPQSNAKLSKDGVLYIVKAEAEFFREDSEQTQKLFLGASSRGTLCAAQQALLGFDQRARGPFQNQRIAFA